MGNLRPATLADNAALLELFGAVPMSGKLLLSTRREPDFFGLYRLQRGITDCRVYDSGGRIAGLGTVLVRDGWIDGRTARVGYLGDLRIDARASREHVVARVYSGVIEEAMRVHGCERFYTAVLASNALALNSLVRRGARRASQPRYHLMRRFTTTSIQFTAPQRVHASRFDVRVATTGDVPAIVELLDRDHRRRPFGYRYDTGELEHRLAHWPGMSLEQTYVACDASGRLVGVTTVWDTAPVKRYRVVAYRGSMRWSKLAFNAAASVLDWPRLPDPGHDFRSLYLCNTSIDGDRPDVLRALIERIYEDFRRSGYHFFSLCVYENDPLEPALRGFTAQRLGFHLYEVTPAGADPLATGEGRPGFEMALA